MKLDLTPLEDALGICLQEVKHLLNQLHERNEALD